MQDNGKDMNHIDVLDVTIIEFIVYVRWAVVLRTHESSSIGAYSIRLH